MLEMYFNYSQASNRKAASCIYLHVPACGNYGHHIRAINHWARLTLNDVGVLFAIRREMRFGEWARLIVIHTPAKSSIITK